VVPRFLSKPVVGCCCSVGRQTFDQGDDFKSLLGASLRNALSSRKLSTVSPRWSPELVVQLCNRGRSFHLAPLLGRGNACKANVKTLFTKVDTAAMETERFALTKAA
jgi:hypothetical protein